MSKIYLRDKKCNSDEDCIKRLEDIDKIKGKLKISYVRVSSQGQKDDLERQKNK